MPFNLDNPFVRVLDDAKKMRAERRRADPPAVKKDYDWTSVMYKPPLSVSEAKRQGRKVRQKPAS